MQFWFCAAILVMLVFPKTLEGQASAANDSLSGRVQDSNGAVVAGAQVSLDRPYGRSAQLSAWSRICESRPQFGAHFLLTKAAKEGPSATLAINSFNVLNHENDVTYVGVVSSPFFGQPIAAQPPRRMQLDLEFKF
jgi:hypothetical protein